MYLIYSQAMEPELSGEAVEPGGAPLPLAPIAQPAPIQVIG